MTLKKGFTLIELLVVIALIAILAALLFPVFAKAREKARAIACMSNHKQVATAWSMYCHDYDEKGIPFSSTGGSGGVAFVWNTVIQPYIKNTQVTICPSNSTNLSMAYNFWLGGNGTPLAQIALPAQTPSFADANGVYLSSGPTQCLVFVLQAQVPCDGGRILTYPTDNPQTKTFGWTGDRVGRIFASVHSDGANYAFVDGHVKWLHYEFDNTHVDIPGPNNIDYKAPPKTNLDYNLDGVIGPNPTTGCWD